MDAGISGAGLVLRAQIPDAIAQLFSERELQIFVCLMTGVSNKIIARKLDLSEATIKVHMKNVLHKIKATNRTEAALWLAKRSNAFFAEVCAIRKELGLPITEGC